MTDVVDFAAHARRYVQRKGWDRHQGEDIVQTMVLDVLEHPERPVALRYVYLRALDTLNPRLNPRVKPPGPRRRHSQRLVSLDAPCPSRHGDDRTLHDLLAAPPAGDREPWAPADLTRLLRRLPPRDARLLRGYYLDRQREHELGQALGVTESRVSQLLTQAQRHFTYYMHLERRRHAPRRTRVSGV